MHVGFRSLEMEARKNDVGDRVGESFAYTTCPSGRDDLWSCGQRPSEKSPGTREPNAAVPSDELIYDATTSRWPVENGVSEIPQHREKHIRWPLSCTDISSRYLSQVVKIIGSVSRCLTEKGVTFNITRSGLPTQHDRVKLIDTLQ